MDQEQDQFSISQQEELKKIQDKLPLMQEFFTAKGFPPQSQMSDQLWFFPQISQDTSHLLWNVFSSYTKRSTQIFKQDDEPDNSQNDTIVEQFVMELNKAIAEMHIEIVSRQLSIEYLTRNQQQIKEALTSLKENPVNTSESAIVINYIENKTTGSEIFRYYDLTYAAGTIHQSFQPVYSINSNRVCTLSLDPLDKMIYFSISGKRLDRKYQDDYKRLAQIDLPLSEVYNAIRPKYFSLASIPPAYLKIPFYDSQQDAPLRGKFEIEFEFDLKLEQNARELILKDQQMENSNLLKQMEDQMESRIKLMDQLLLPFQKDPAVPQTIQKELNYVKARGFGQPSDFPPIQKYIEENNGEKPRNSCCEIF